MKLIVVQFPDSVDITTIPKGTTPITVTNGTTSITGGELMAQTDMTDPPEAELVPHVHPATTEVGGPLTP